MTAPLKFTVAARQQTVDLLTQALAANGLDRDDAEKWAEQMTARAVAAGGIGGLTKSAKTEFYSEHHHPLGTEGLWNHEGLQLPAYIQNVAKGLMEDGHPREEAIPMAIGTVKRWAAGGGKVTPEVQAASAKAVAEWEALKASHGKAILAELEKWNPDQPRGPHGRWIHGLGNALHPSAREHADLHQSAADAFTQHGAGDAGPKATSIDRAIARIGHGEGVQFEKPKQVVTLVDRLQSMVEQAKGGAHKVFNLCDVSVAGTNLFCHGNLGIDRGDMPQLGGKPAPGSPADALPRNKWGEVNITDGFVAHLQAKGVPMTRETVPSSQLRSSQDQLDGEKVAEIVKAIDEGKAGPPPDLVVSQDGYIVDGHHRWAADVADGMEAGKSDPPQNVVRVNMPILQLLKAANDYATSQGLGHETAGQGFHVTKDFNPDEARGPHGEWVRGIGLDSHAHNAEASIHVQDKAQAKAEQWYDNGPGASSFFDDPTTPYGFWGAYQNPDDYGDLNAVLRGQTSGQQAERLEGAGYTRPELMRSVDAMFQQAGTTTDRPITLWRALRSDNINWAQKLKPGSTFTDKGMISTTANGDFSEGWLGLGPEGEPGGHPTNPDDVVMEIHVPTGSRVVGGSTQFIETMLHPNAQFRIVSSQRTVGHPHDPLGTADTIDASTYTRVVVDMTNDGTGHGQG